MMLRVITMTAYRRPAYTRQVLDALSRCDGITDWVLLPAVEPGNDEVIAAFRQFSACESRLTVNEHRRGLNRNTHDALWRAFKRKADVIVHLEDDTVPSPDALQYFDWAVRELLMPDVKAADGCQITLASGYNKPDSEPTAEQSHRCASRPIFTCWGWAVDRHRLHWMLTNWCFRDPNRFTVPFRRKFNSTRREVYPRLSRIQNIGVEDGTNYSARQRREHRTPWVAGPEHVGGQFHLHAVKDR